MKLLAALSLLLKQRRTSVKIHLLDPERTPYAQLMCVNLDVEEADIPPLYSEQPIFMDAACHCIDSGPPVMMVMMKYESL